MMGVRQTGLTRGEGKRGLALAVLVALLLTAVLVLVMAVLVLALTVAAGFLHEEVLWMYIEFPEPIVLAA